MFGWAEWIASLIAFKLLGLDPAGQLGEAVRFFVYDMLKITVMLSVIIYLVTLLRSFFPPERTRKLLSSYRYPWIGNIAAALLGVVTPFCSCSAVTALSLPELIILRRVLKPQLLAIFVGVMTVTIIGVGYLFNAVT